MAIIASDLKYLLSSNPTTDPNLSLGGAISAIETAVTDNVLHNLFDLVDGPEATAGDIEYRCIYVKNDHATQTLSSTKLWVDTVTPAAGSDISIGLDLAGLNGTADTVVDESTAPSPTVVFSTAVGEGQALILGDMIAQSYYAIWIRRTITAAAAAYAADSVVLRLKGISPA